MLGALGICVAVASCGGGANPDRAAFVTAASRICTQADRAAARLSDQIRVAQRGSDPQAVYREIAVLTRRQAATTGRSLDRLDALAVPNHDRDALKGWIAAQRQRQTLVAELATAFDRRDDAQISTLSQHIDKQGAASDAFAVRYGLPACAKSRT